MAPSTPPLEPLPATDSLGRKARKGYLMRSSRRRNARARLLVEGSLRGLSAEQLAEQFGLCRDTVFTELKYADKKGLVDEVRDKLLSTLDKVPLVYQKVLDSDPEELHKKSRGFKLQVDVANSLSEGLGVFQKESVKHNVNTLELIAAEGGETMPFGGTIEGPRVRFLPSAEEVESEEAALEAERLLEEKEKA